MPILITGGARSGKSTFAERYAAKLGGSGIYIATAQPFDDEMKARLALHRERRDADRFGWETIEEPLQLAALLRSVQEHEQFGRVVLVDCLTLWLSNWMLHWEQDEAMEQRVMANIEELVETVRQFEGKLLLVTNEVGDGVVPAYRLGRQFRDLAGVLNQRLAAHCEQVFLVTCGIPVDLKQFAFRLD